jgi:hypothetical protein
MFKDAKEFIATTALQAKLTLIDTTLRSCGAYVDSHDGVFFGFKYGEYTASCMWDDDRSKSNCWTIYVRNGDGKAIGEDYRGLCIEEGRIL